MQGEVVSFAFFPVTSHASYVQYMQVNPVPGKESGVMTRLEETTHFCLEDLEKDALNSQLKKRGRSVYLSQRSV